MADKDDKNLIIRPPIVVVMGHIDHGKTTLLDYIRKTKVTEAESGGITQHVAAYEVEAPSLTFIDTPGHAAFKEMRVRGAGIADVAILIIAADDGVMEQTKEALSAIKKTGIPFVVAINKIDKPNANIEKVKKDLAENDVLVEGWGGKIPCVEVSAKTGEGIDALLEMLLLVSELENPKSNPQENASGFVLESHIDKKRGTAGTLIIKNGSLSQGMCVVAGDAIAPVRIFENFKGEPIKEAEASSPVRIVGFNKLPKVGAEFTSCGSKKEAEKVSLEICEEVVKEKKEKEEESEKEEVEKVVVPIVVKADVLGSLEALLKEIKNLENEKVEIKILKSEVGDISEDDIKLASSGEKAIVLGFRVKCSEQNRSLCERYGSTLQLFDVIYELEEWLVKEIEKRVPQEISKEILGKVKILKIFSSEKNKKIIGGEVVEGKIAVKKDVSIKRRDYELGKGKVLGLKKFQVSVDEATEGEQVGILIQTKTDIVPKDILEIFESVIK